MNRVVHVFSGADDFFYPGLAVSVLSCLNCLKADRTYCFHILDGGISQRFRDDLEQRFIQVVEDNILSAKILWHEVDDDMLDGLPFYKGSVLTYVKLMIPTLFPQIDEAIYIDADILFNKGIEDFLSTSKEERTLLVGVRDFFHHLGNECPDEQLTDLEKESPYINAGVLWLNCEKLRELKLLKHAKEFLNKYKGIKFGDQTIFNYICRERIQTLSEVNNFCIGLGKGVEVIDKGEIANLHYIGQNKPWLNPPETRSYTAYLLWWAFVDRAGLSEGLKRQMEDRPRDYIGSYLKSVLYRFNKKRMRAYRADIKSVRMTRLKMRSRK